METKRVARRKHSAQFRAGVLQACRQADASVAAIALRNGLNANVVYRWLREEARGVEADAGSHAAVSARHGAEFIALQMPQPAVAAASPEIRVEVRRPGATTVTVTWPVQCAGECAAWLREWLR
jgi:transposase